MNTKSEGRTRLILLAAMCQGGWLALGSGVLMIVGVILLFSSFAGLVFLTRRKLTQPLAGGEADRWGRISEGGKSRYVRGAAITGLLVGVISSSVILFDSIKDRGLRAVDLEIFAATVLIFVFTFYYGATRVWDVNEKRSKKP
jgi:succinate dehydrogenase hydrophobic anchor subunit